MVKKKMVFQKPGRNSKNSKNLEEIQKTWRKFPKNLWPPCLFFQGLLISALFN